MLGPAAAALESAAGTAANAGSSLAETRDAAAQASELMTRLASSFEDLASLGNFQILGARPFESISGEFAQVAEQSRTVSVDLAQAATAMDRNIDDSALVAAELRVLSGQLGELEASLGGSEGEAPGPSDASLPVNAARFVLVGLLLWLAVPAIASISIGWRWMRAAAEV